MPTYLPERRAAPGDQSASIVLLIAALAMLLLVALSWIELSFGSNGDIVAILS
jgi:hypothetical protein